jgi:hypothetical protein
MMNAEVNVRFFAALLILCSPLAAAVDLRLSNRFLDVQFDEANGAMRVTDQRTKRVWTQQPFKTALAVKRMARKDGGVRIEFADFSAAVALSKNVPEIEITLEAQGPLPQPLGFPLPFVTGKGTSLVVPLNEGILYPADDETVRPMQLVTYGGHGICMPWFGVFESAGGAGWMAILETPDDARIDIARQPGAGLIIRPLWEASRQEFRYPRKIRYVFFDKGGYLAQTKRYRAYAQQTGLFKTLAAKRQENPNVDLLVGAANIWSWETDKLALCQELKAAGLDRVLWSGGGTPAQIEAINKLGYLTSHYDIYQDVWPPDAPPNARKEGWPDDLVWLPNGDWMKGWAIHRTNPDGTKTVIPGGVITSSRQVQRANQRVPEELKTHAYGGRFIDTTTASPFREDYNPAHPLTRSEDRKNKMALLEFMSKDMKLVTGTETGIDPSVPYVHFYEGMLSLGPYRLPDSGRDMIKYKPPTPEFLKFQVGHVYRVPLWELVYHECVVAQWYWGDYNNKAPEVWDRRDLFNLLYGTPPMYMFDKTSWPQLKERIVESYKSIAPTVRKLGYEEMLAHEFLSEDHAVQSTRWKSGTQIIVNFGAADYRLPDGRTVKAMGSLVTN